MFSNIESSKNLMPQSPVVAESVNQWLWTFLHQQSDLEYLTEYHNMVSHRNGFDYPAISDGMRLLCEMRSPVARIATPAHLRKPISVPF